MTPLLCVVTVMIGLYACVDRIMDALDDMHRRQDERLRGENNQQGEE